MATPLVPSPQDTIDAIVRTLTAGLVQAGVVQPVVEPGSDFYLICEALGTQLSVIFQSIVSTADGQMPDTATGSDLDRLLTTYGLARRPASNAFGFITFDTAGAVLVPTGSQLISNNGLLYQVITGGVYANSDLIELESLDTGLKANLPLNSILTWVSAPAFASPTQVVSTAISGGVDAEDDATARARLLARLANPPSFGNWQQTVDLILGSDPSIQYAFIYPCVNGPATEHAAITRTPSATDKTRNIVISPVLDTATSTIQGNIPTYVETVVTTVANVNHDVSFGITIPFPVGATQLGLGGGWANYNPFPIAEGTALNFCDVTAVTDSTHFTFKAYSPGGVSNSALQTNVSKIAWIDKSNPTGWLIRTAIITASTFSNLGGNVGSYAVTIDNPFVGIAVGDYISPAAQNLQVYLDTVLDQFANLGPGQKTNLSALLPRALRKPLTVLSYPDTVGAQFLKAVVDSSTEVEDASFIFRTYSGNEPAVPASVSSAPNIFIPNQIAFYPSP